MKIVCPECGTHDTLSPERWRCECGGAWEPEEVAWFDPGLIDPADATIWRYRRLYGLDFETPAVRLSSGTTILCRPTAWPIGYALRPDRRDIRRLQTPKDRNSAMTTLKST